MLLVFLGLYVVLAVGSLVMGVRSRSRRALVCGLVALGFAAASALVSAVYAAGVTHWTVSVLDLLLSPCRSRCWSRNRSRRRWRGSVSRSS